MTMQGTAGVGLDRRAAFEATVGDIYSAFGRGDVAAILDALADDVRWEEWTDNTAQREPAVPYLLPRRGPAEVAEFFATLGTLTFHDFRVLTMCVGDDEVVARLVADFELPHGGRVRDEEIHWWQFDADGKVSAFRHYLDTAKHRAAAAGQDTTAGGDDRRA